jgi:phage repressor protein C with HTH and peptisase S24 domain
MRSSSSAIRWSRATSRAIVSPRAPVRPGDDVIVQLRGKMGEDGRADKDSGLEEVPDLDHLNRVTLVLVKRLVRQTSRYVELEQFNPPQTFQVPIARVAAVHRIMTRF